MSAKIIGGGNRLYLMRYPTGEVIWEIDLRKKKSVQEKHVVALAYMFSVKRIKL